MIQLNSVNKNYSDGDRKIEVLKNINFELKSGSIVSIKGPSGCGKSTLLSCMAGLLPIDSGKISVDQLNIQNMDQKQLHHFRAKNIGFIFQQFHLLPHLNAYENTRLPLDILNEHSYKEAEARTQWALELVRISHRQLNFPHQLSRGESQRVAIARAIVHDPQYLFADEPTASLDRTLSLQIANELIQICKSNSKTLIMVTHDLKIAELCPIQIEFENGQITHSSLS